MTFLERAGPPAEIVGHVAVLRVVLLLQQLNLFPIANKNVCRLIRPRSAVYLIQVVVGFAIVGIEMLLAQ
ncbi:hypothetical protein ACFFJT_16155 [Dyella flava]|uniref:MAPEG family protein n=1 Tax=Dyella flava TaxID=1920170 RepID=A0ABS2K505_9GAMM|nr:hypothetical protein [Dyella flava]MBM7125363.1 hypothetical protein [Dyella flava]GLQ51777.1 hypothetical protein GCM10010872_32260 [Dyella flava]